MRKAYFLNCDRSCRALSLPPCLPLCYTHTPTNTHSHRNTRTWPSEWETCRPSRWTGHRGWARERCGGAAVCFWACWAPPPPCARCPRHSSSLRLFPPTDQRAGPSTAAPLPHSHTHSLPSNTLPVLSKNKGTAGLSFYHSLLCFLSALKSLPLSPSLSLSQGLKYWFVRKNKKIKTKNNN